MIKEGEILTKPDTPHDAAWEISYLIKSWFGAEEARLVVETITCLIDDCGDYVDPHQCWEKVKI